MYLARMRIWCSLFLLVPSLAIAQAGPTGLLWSVSGQGLSRTNYLLGTMHSRDARAFRQVPRLLEVMAGQDAVAGELDLTAGATASAGLLMAMMMPADTSLADLYTKRKFKRVKEAMQEHLGMVALLGTRMRPFFLMGLLSETVMRSDSDLVLDQYLQRKAKEMGKDVLGIETMEEQVAAVADLPLQDQADMLYDLVRHDLYRADMDRMLEAYAAQDLDKLAAIATLGGLPERFNTRLLVDRNAVMAQRMDSLMQGGRSFFFAVGAGHLPGAQGIVQRLRAMGYRVEAVKPGP